MKFGIFLAFLFLLYEVSFYLVSGQTTDNKSDCTKLYNFLNGDDADYANKCCTGTTGLYCDNEGFITYFNNTEANIAVPNMTSFPFFSRITDLAIRGANLKEIPEVIFKLTTLKKLDFKKNFIEIIPSAIQNLSQLEELNFRDNNIKNIPDEIFTLKNLRYLTFGLNHIEVIPPAIQNLSQLEELYFW